MLSLALAVSGDRVVQVLIISNSEATPFQIKALATWIGALVPFALGELWIRYTRRARARRRARSWDLRFRGHSRPTQPALACGKVSQTM